MFIQQSLRPASLVRSVTYKRISDQRKLFDIYNQTISLSPKLPVPVAAAVVGPMTRDLPSLITMTKAILESFPWQDDVDVVEMPWKEEVLQSIRNRSCVQGERDGRLTFGIMACDQTVKAHPPVQRAIKIVKEALLEHGYEVCSRLKVRLTVANTRRLQVVEWDPPSHNTATDLLVCQTPISFE